MSLGAIKNDGSGVSEKHALFCEYYLAYNMNGVKAAIAAGYSEKGAASQACKMLSDPNIRKYFDKKLNEIVKGKNALAVKLIEEYKKIAFGDPELEKKLKHADKISAMDKLAKYIRLFDETQRVEISGPGGAAIDFDFSKMSDEKVKMLNDMLDEIKPGESGDL